MRTLSLLFLVIMANPAMATEAVTSCDWEVGHPSDPQHVGPGVSSSDVDTDKAIAACKAAVDAYPQVARFHYQLGRALVYHADRTEGDSSVGMPHLRRAADMGSPQAQFVYGLMLQRFDKPLCEVEPWYRAAADNGLKSARLSYVNASLDGAWVECENPADPSAMVAYLDGAATQVNGYYENMLLGALRRQLEAKD